MPQMSPMWWSMLLNLFFLTYILYMINIFYIFEKKNTKTMKMFNKNMMNLNWKW